MAIRTLFSHDAWKRLPRQLLASLLPAQCALCAGPCRELVCVPCRQQYLEQTRPRCRQCANPLDDMAQLCGRCLRRPPAYDATFTAADYAAPVDQLLLQLKFGARLAHAPLFAQLLCPVPLGPARLVERGYNQALEIARPLARHLDIALQARLALRVRETRAQSGVAPRERRANLAHAFIAEPAFSARLAACHVGIVDDVMSSGHTVHALAAALKRAGARKVTVLVAARTPPH